MSIASAPSKLIVLGEWSVLRHDGAAVVLAVDQRTVVEAIRSPHFQVGRDGRLTPLPDDIATLPEELKFLGFCLDYFRRRDPGQPLILRSLAGITTPGLGSSASIVTSALRAGFIAQNGSVCAGELLDAALLVHHLAQGKKGSGCDVAAAVTGACVAYRRTEHERPEIASFERACLPPLCAAFSGSKASTTALLGAVERARVGDPQRYEALIDGLQSCANDGITALQMVDRPAFVRAADAAGHLLDELSVFSGGILTPPSVQTLIAIAREHGCAAKFSGAGGGDCVFALHADANVIADVSAAWNRAGFERVALTADVDGARQEHRWPR